MTLCTGEAHYHQAADSRDRTGEGQKEKEIHLKILCKIKLASNIVIKLLNVY
jgi:hypothetical protein